MLIEVHCNSYIGNHCATVSIYIEKRGEKSVCEVGAPSRFSSNSLTRRESVNDNETNCKKSIVDEFVKKLTEDALKVP